jgi:hypothetical protein
MDNKICNICNLSKPIKYFVGRYKTCNDCRNAKRKQVRLLNNDYRNKNEELKTQNLKLCKYCNTIQNINDFRNNRLKCKTCEKEYGKQYRKSDIGKQKSNEWIISNVEKYKNLQSEWYQKNKSNINLKNKIKLENNPILKLIKNYRRRLNLVLKKEASTLQYLNCSQELLHKFINYYLNYNDKLNLNNYGSEWHIDHVIPISLLDLNNKNNLWCLEWFNLAPLTSKDNLKKNNSIDKLQIKSHLNIVNKFIKINEIQNIKLEYIATYLN